MKTYQITPLHINAGAYNGQIFFLLDNRLLTVNFGTPLYNDYNQWRLKDIILADQPYKMEDGLTPFEFEPISITQDELDMLKLIFSPITNETDEEISEWENQVLSFEMRNPDYHNPLRYIAEYEEVLTSVELADNKLVHILFDAVHSKKDDVNQEWESEEGEHLEHEKWTPKGNLAYYHGLYDLLIPIVKTLMEHYKKEDAITTNDVFVI